MMPSFQLDLTDSLEELKAVGRVIQVHWLIIEEPIQLVNGDCNELMNAMHAVDHLSEHWRVIVTVHLATNNSVTTPL
jgi:hypothetical protein